MLTCHLRLLGIDGLAHSLEEVELCYTPPAPLHKLSDPTHHTRLGVFEGCARASLDFHIACSRQDFRSIASKIEVITGTETLAKGVLSLEDLICDHRSAIQVLDSFPTDKRNWLTHSGSTQFAKDVSVLYLVTVIGYTEHALNDQMQGALATLQRNARKFVTQKRCAEIWNIYRSPKSTELWFAIAAKPVQAQGVHSRRRGRLELVASTQISKEIASVLSTRPTASVGIFPSQEGQGSNFRLHIRPLALRLQVTTEDMNSNKNSKNNKTNKSSSADDVSDANAILVLLESPSNSGYTVSGVLDTFDSNSQVLIFAFNANSFTAQDVTNLNKITRGHTCIPVAFESSVEVSRMFEFVGRQLPAEAHSSKPLSHQGTLMKVRHFGKFSEWKPRYCVVGDGKFSYYKTEESKGPKRSCSLEECCVVIDPIGCEPRWYTIAITHPTPPCVYLTAATQESFER
eukprot:c20710_g1_i6.p1 GENE.c20710_g1_i6~~c20710_g1_i6.p1  ORF type:complete len:458 (+),score=92.16 c20710_g1_i6:30-1403(+)